VLERWRDAISSAQPFEMVFPIRGADGVFRPFLTRINPAFDEHGAVTNWFGVNTDISLQVEAEDAFAKSEAKFRTLADAMPQMVWSASPTGFLDYHNARWYEFTGTPVGATDGHGWTAMLPPDDAEPALSAWRRSLETGDPYHVEFRLRHCSGDYRWVLCRAQAERDEKGLVARWYGTCTDIEDIVQARNVLKSSLAQAQAALLQSQKLEAMGQLTGGVAHDFNNLLTPILGSLDMLRRRGIGSPREQRLINGAYQSAERATTLVQRLLAFARRQPLQSVAVDIGALIREMADLIAGTTGPQITLVVEIAGDLPAAKADPHQLEMALLNLSVNARDAMNGVGKIKIAATRETVAAGQIAQLNPGSYVRISVADTGIGMDEATRARAVEPFFSTKGIGKGTGLGLSMAHGLASQLGGTLTIASAPGRGAEISIWLPETSLAAPPPDNRRMQAAMPQSGAALLVDDEEYIRLSTADMLTELGFSVHEAASAEAALRAIDAGLQPDILITDHLMPGMTGVELAHAVKIRRPAMKVLIVSGFAEGDGIDPSLPRLTKPFVQSDLAAALAALREH
jgi:PAS domain S-box-containing protein